MGRNRFRNVFYFVFYFPRSFFSFFFGVGSFCDILYWYYYLDCILVCLLIYISFSSYIAISSIWIKGSVDVFRRYVLNCCF